MRTVCVLFGGVSSEYEVSLRSAASVLRNLDPDQYEIVMVGITRDGRWLRYHGAVSAIEDGTWQDGDVCPCILSPDRQHGGLLAIHAHTITPIAIDVVFPVLHGKNGEDGTVQGLLALAGIPFVGCGVLASAACMDKDVSHTLLEAAGVPKTKLMALTRQDIADFDALEQTLSQTLSYPMFVKPANAGSSVGVSKAKNAQELRDAISLALSHDRKIVVERTLTGKEVEVAVMGNEAPVASAVVGEIVPHNEFYDYQGKYLDNSTDLYVPARISEETIEQLRKTAVRAYSALGCAGLARVDFFVTDAGEIVLNEINTMPGFTSISMYPKLFEASGIPYPELIDRLIDHAIARS